MKTLKIFAWFAILIIGFIAGVSWKNKDTQPEERQNTPATINNLLVGEFPEGLNNTEKKTINLFEKSAPSVCFITTSNVRRDFFSRNIMEVPRGTGSGFVWDENVYPGFSS